jgi:hypothetical protein
MRGSQQDVRVAAVDNLRVQANRVMLGARDHIEVSHLDALRIADLVREITKERDNLKATQKQLWERMDTLERHIERLGSNTDDAFTEGAN